MNRRLMYFIALALFYRACEAVPLSLESFRIPLPKTDSDIPIIGVETDSPNVAQPTSISKFIDIFDHMPNRVIVNGDSGYVSDDQYQDNSPISSSGIVSAISNTLVRDVDSSGKVPYPCSVIDPRRLFNTCPPDPDAKSGVDQTLAGPRVIHMDLGSLLPLA